MKDIRIDPVKMKTMHNQKITGNQEALQKVLQNKETEIVAKQKITHAKMTYLSPTMTELVFVDVEGVRGHESNPFSRRTLRELAHR
jgi:hypothetical protein